MVFLLAFWYIFPRKSGNPGVNSFREKAELAKAILANKGLPEAIKRHRECIIRHNKQ
jgi:hypothetical protein